MIKKGSTITPTWYFISKITTALGLGARFMPRAPKKDDMYLCDGVYDRGFNTLCIRVDGLRVVDKDGGDIDLGIELFEEVAPPIDLSEITKECKVSTE